MGHGRDQFVIHEERGLGRAEVHVAGIAGGHHRQVQLHGLDHAETPALGAVKRDVAIARTLETEQVSVAQGLVDDADARVTREYVVDRLPDPDLMWIANPGPVLRLEDQRDVLARSEREGRLERRQDAQGVLALDEGERVEGRQEDEGIFGDPQLLP